MNGVLGRGPGREGEVTATGNAVAGGTMGAGALGDVAGTPPGLAAPPLPVTPPPIPSHPPVPVQERGVGRCRGPDESGRGRIGEDVMGVRARGAPPGPAWEPRSGGSLRHGGFYEARCGPNVRLVRKGIVRCLRLTGRED